MILKKKRVLLRSITFFSVVKFKVRSKLEDERFDSFEKETRKVDEKRKFEEI